MNTLNDNFYSYSDILNDSTMNAGNINVNSITVSGLTPNELVATDSSQTLISYGITGTANEIDVLKTPTKIILSTPQDINTNSNVVFNSIVVQGATVNGITGNIANLNELTISSLTENEFIGVDTSKRFVSRGISGTDNQINITYGSAGITLSTPQDINTTSSPQFNQLNLTGNLIQNISGNKGFVIGEIANDTPPNYAGIVHQSLANSFANCCLVQNEGGDTTFNALEDKILVFAQGGIHRLRVLKLD